VNLSRFPNYSYPERILASTVSIFLPSKVRPFVANQMNYGAGAEFYKNDTLFLVTKFLNN
jgi:hypothetical protein